MCEDESDNDTRANANHRYCRCNGSFRLETRPRGRRESKEVGYREAHINKIMIINEY